MAEPTEPTLEHPPDQDGETAADRDGFGPDGLVELLAGKPAAGGGCVSRLPDGRVAFVRHTIPGETVLAKITESTKSYVRADAVTIGEASEHRVRPPCRFSGPGKCGGCDWQHIDLPMQREMKAALVAEQLRRIAGIDAAVAVESVPGDKDGLGWRTRVRYGVVAKGRLGFFKSRSHELLPVDRCVVAAPGIQRLAPEQLNWKGAASVEVFAPEPTGELTVSVESRRGARAEIPRFDGGLVVEGRTVREPSELELRVLGRRFTVSGGGFWQAHLGAPAALGKALIEMASPGEGTSVADLYAGAGLFSVLLADAVGPTGHLLVVEQFEPAARDAARNLVDSPHADVLCDRVTPEVVTTEMRRSSLCVLDPPRQGAGIPVMETLTSLGDGEGSGRLRRIAYVACDPASFARDLRVCLDRGWSLTALRAFDLFPMTEHVELVAIIDSPAGAGEQ